MTLWTPPGARWTAETFESLRVARGGPQPVPLLANMPDVLIDLSGMIDLMAQGRLSNPLIQAVQAAQRQIETERKAGTFPEAGSDAFWERHRKTLEWQDELLAAIVLDPPWCKLGDLPTDGSRPPGMICIYDLTPEERRLGADLAFTGVDGLETFRALRRGAHAGGDGGTAAPETEQLVSVDAPTAGAGLLVRSGDLAARPAPRAARGRAKSGQRSA